MAVYTEVTDEDVQAFASRFDIGTVISLKGIAEGVENSNYLMVTDRDQFILTLYEKRVHRTDLPFFIGLMRHLADRGVNCPLPVAASDGEALHELAGRPAAVFTFLEGMWPRRITVRHCAELGPAMARMHLAGSDFAMTRANALGPSAWRPLYNLSADRAHLVDPALPELVSTALDRFDAQWPTGLPSGLIHADLFPDNVFFRDEELTGLIDFYFACTDFLAYDIAVALNAWCFEPDGAFNTTKARALLTGYQRLRPLAPEEMAALPVLAAGAAARFLLTRLYDWLNHPDGAFVKPKDPVEYLRKLRFHSKAADPAAYGLPA
ncbi:homoserine kinase [Fodinicurvata sp. EGI_FJ10296]|uniref:homoserine kinase n=1 Tax=Fodinicurvata sp. EGI_FJ10296 TaxID=3231908 RepID=UPI003454081F